MRGISGILCGMLLGLNSAIPATTAGKIVRFQFQAPAGARTVTLAGNFNAWSRTQNPMQDPDQNGVWETSVELNYGEYEYRFVVNDDQWFRDPLNPNFGGAHSNSIRIVSPPEQPHLTKVTPEIGSRILTLDFEVGATFSPGVNQAELNPDATHVWLNDQRIPFEYHAATRQIRARIQPGSDGGQHLEITGQDRAGRNTPTLKSFFWINAVDTLPIAEAGFARVVTVADTTCLSAAGSFDPDFDPITDFRWQILETPADCNLNVRNLDQIKLTFTPEQPGRYRFSVQVQALNRWSQPDTVVVWAVSRPKSAAHFTFDARPIPQTVTRVDVVGEFNRWQLGTQLQEIEPGKWARTLELSPGEYEYKLVLNQKDWLPDPANPQRVADGWNGFNSIRPVNDVSAPIPQIEARLSPPYIQLNATPNLSQTGDSLRFRWFAEPHHPALFQGDDTARPTLALPPHPGAYTFYVVAEDPAGASATRTISLDIQAEKIQLHDLAATPAWTAEAIIYEIFVQNFTDQGTLAAIEAQLPCLDTLGINAIWLMPIFESPQEHGYGPTNFFRVAEKYGANADLKNLITAAHQRGMKVILDFIANHSSDQHPFFQAAFYHPHSIFRDWYRWRSDSLLSTGLTWEYHNDWDQLPNFNYENPLVWNYMLKIGKFWQEFGVDGYRCDVAWGVPHPFWKVFRRQLKRHRSDFLLLNEVLPRATAYHEDEFDMSYDTDFYGNLLDVLNQKKPVAAIDYGLRKTQKNYPGTTLSLRYLENHDLPRFIQQFGLERTRLAATLLFTMPGTPLVYYGQEFGVTDQRPRLNWTLARQPLWKFYQTLIHLRREQPAFTAPELISVATDQPQVYAYLRGHAPSPFLVVLNFAAEPLICQLKFPLEKAPSVAPGRRLTNVLTPNAPDLFWDAGHPVKLTLTRYEAAIYRLVE
ncbi:hypothetical protein L0128_18900 [candidate division KSB1 bacterium]|nr:hypothetical protein [candidate division KSB1 bacterium]